MWYRVGPPAVRVVRAVRGVFGNHAVSSNRLGKRRRGRSRHHFSNPGIVVVVVFVVVVPGSRRHHRRVWWTLWCRVSRNGRDSVSRMRGATDVRLGRDAGALRVVSHREQSRFWWFWRGKRAKARRVALPVSRVRGDVDVHERRDERELRGVSRDHEYGWDRRGGGRGKVEQSGRCWGRGERVSGRGKPAGQIARREGDAQRERSRGDS